MHQLLKSPQVVDREIMESVQTHAQWREWSEARPPNLHSIAVQLLSAASGAVRRDPFLARREFEKNLMPKPKESLRHLLVRIDGELIFRNSKIPVFCIIRFLLKYGRPFALCSIH